MTAKTFDKNIQENIYATTGRVKDARKDTLESLDKLITAATKVRDSLAQTAEAGDLGNDGIAQWITVHHEDVVKGVARWNQASLFLRALVYYQNLHNAEKGGNQA